MMDEVKFERVKTDGEPEVGSREDVDKLQNPPSMQEAIFTYEDGTTEKIPIDHIIQIS